MKTLLLLALSFASAQAETFQAKVVRVTDGDTVVVFRQGKPEAKVRLLGIDAPERKQPFGAKAREALREKAAGRLVQVDTHKKDRYGRLLGRLRLGSRDLNLELVAEGWAWHYARYARDQFPGDASLYAAAAARAKQEGRGLWAQAQAGSEPQAPWDFRRQRGVASPSTGSASSVGSAPHAH